MLYFIGAGDRIKIGISSNPSLRRSALQTGNPVECHILLAVDIENDAEIEKLLHSRLHAHRQQGEWFRISLSTAFEHLSDIRQSIRFRDRNTIPVPKPRPLQLSDCESEFEAWLMSTERVEPSQWDRQAFPLWYMWDILHKEFLKERTVTPTV